MKVLKSVIKVFLLPVILIVSQSCGQRKILEEPKLTFREFEKREVLSFKPLVTLESDIPKLMFINDSILITVNYNKRKSFWVDLFNIKNKTHVGERLPYGMGPNESTGILSAGILNDSLWLHDVAKKEIIKVNISDLINLESPAFVSHRISHAMIYKSSAAINDSIFIGTSFDGLGLQGYKFNYYSIYNDTIVKYGYKFLESNNDFPAFRSAYANCVGLNLKKEKFFLSYQYTDVVEVYDLEGNLITSWQGPDNFSPEFTVGQGPQNTFMRHKNESRYAYRKPSSFSTEDFIYLIYSGDKRTASKEKSSNSLVVFSWEGRPLKQYTIPFTVSSFTIDENQNTIITYREETSEYVYAKLN